MTTHRAVAIDGPAASGKSTVARILAEKLGLLMVNSGEMYRAVTWQLIQEGVDPADAESVREAVEALEITGEQAEGVSTVRVNGRLLGEELRAPEVNAAVSQVAAVPRVREILVDLQRSYLEREDVVMEGRDIGSVVFPDTPFKLYITASEEVRSQRRAADGEQDSVAARDARDSGRKASPLLVAEGAVTIDSSELSLDETVGAACAALRELGWESTQEEK